jgi:Copper transport outer membrane protein, MctB
MIDFRYHLVSIVAVFLALGLGIVLGATALQPGTIGFLYKTSQQEHHQIDSALAANSQLSRQLSSDDQVAAAIAPQLLHQLLAGQRVVMVEAPGAAPQAVTGISQALTQAGATVSGQVQLQGKFFDFSQPTQEQLGQLAQRYSPPGSNLRGSEQAQASEALAKAILTRDGPSQPAAGVPDATSVALLNSLGAGGFITDSGRPDARATLAVMVIPQSPPSTSNANQASQALVSLAQQLNLAGQGTVVAGTVAGSGPGSAIDIMRNDGRAGHLSSVDDADRAIGQIVVAQALYNQLRRISGSYGALSSASAGGPSPAPTPSASPTASPLASTGTVRPGKS